MKLKIKLPILFLLMFLLITIFIFLFLKSLAVDEGHMWLGRIFSPGHFRMLLRISILMGLMFVVLTIYFHFNADSDPQYKAN
jgi:hypothetical protein